MMIMKKTIDKSQGSVLMWRSIMNTVIWSNPKLSRLYHWIMYRANWESNEVFPTANNKITVKPGQFVTSLDKVAEVIGSNSKSTATAYLDLLIAERRIELKKTNKYTVITVKDWKWLQEIEDKIENKLETNRKQTETDNIYKEKKFSHQQGAGVDNGSKALTPPKPLTKQQILDIAVDLRVSYPDVELMEKEVLNPESIEKYKIKSTGLTVRKWLGRNIREGKQRTLDATGMMLLKDLRVHPDGKVAP